MVRWAKQLVISASLAACCLAAYCLPASAEVFFVTMPFKGPRGSFVTVQDRYHTFRIPGMIVTADGTILAFAEGRRGDGDDPRIDANAPADIVMRRSSDQGQTWEPLVVIDSGFRPNGDLVDFGDPTPVLDATTGMVFLFYGQFPDFGPRFSAYGQSADPKQGNQTLWVRSSNDNGKTWSERKQIDYPDSPQETSDGLYWRYLEPGPGNGIQLKWQQDEARNGRLVVPVKRAGSKTPEGEAVVNPLVYYSDDHGTTWQPGGVSPDPEGNENEVVELADGSLLMDARPDVGTFRRRFLSRDGGATWGPNNPDNIPLTRVDASLARYSASRDGDDRDRLLFSAPGGEGRPGRANLTIWTSYDEGKSFSNPVQFNQGFAAYSVVQRLADGTIGLLVEADADSNEDYGSITFYRFDLAELEQK